MDEKPSSNGLYDGSDLVLFYEGLIERAEQEGQHEVAEHLGRQQERFLGYIYALVQDEYRRLRLDPERTHWSDEACETEVRKNAWYFGKQELGTMIKEARSRLRQSHLFARATEVSAN